MRRCESCQRKLYTNWCEHCAPYIYAPPDEFMYVKFNTNNSTALTTTETKP